MAREIQFDDASGMHERARIPKTTEQDALRRARYMLDEAIAGHAGDPAEWSKLLLDRLRVFGRVFAKHVRDSEANGGSLQEVLLLRPGLSHAVKLIKDEHHSIQMQRAILERIVADQLVQDAVAIEFLRESAGRLLESVRLHQARGADLLYEAYLRDDGGDG